MSTDDGTGRVAIFLQTRMCMTGACEGRVQGRAAAADGGGLQAGDGGGQRAGGGGGRTLPGAVLQLPPRGGERAAEHCGRARGA